jgi:flagellar hook-length control protein FliK
VPLSKGDALKTLNAANSKDDSKSELSEEELAGLSALMAMLPHQQTSNTGAAGTSTAFPQRAQFLAFANAERAAGQENKRSFPHLISQGKTADASLPPMRPSRRPWPLRQRSRNRQFLFIILTHGYPGTDHVQPCHQSACRHRCHRAGVKPAAGYSANGSRPEPAHHAVH